MAKTRRAQAAILQTLAEMLQNPKAKDHHRRAGRQTRLLGQRCTRHFASKAQMFEGLIEFIDPACSRSSTRCRPRNPTASPRSSTHRRARCCASRAEKPWHDPRADRRGAGQQNERLLARINACRQARSRTETIAARRRDAGRIDASLDVGAMANVLVSYAIWSLAGLRQSGFTAEPLAQWGAAVADAGGGNSGEPQRVTSRPGRSVKACPGGFLTDKSQQWSICRAFFDILRRNGQNDLRFLRGVT